MPLRELAGVKYYVLLGMVAVTCCFCGMLWHHSDVGSFSEMNLRGFLESLFYTFQIVLTAGAEDVSDGGAQLTYILMVASGVTLVAVLIGLITDQVNEYMQALSEGSTKVCEKGHTLLLGWNESTARVVCQIAFLRRGYGMQIKGRKYFGKALRVLPSSPVVAAPVVVLSSKPKAEVEALIADIFTRRGIDPKYTKLGRDVVVRCGDPCGAHDLVRVAASKATSILVMMNKVDRLEQEELDGSVDNSATMRCLLALRNILFDGDSEPDKQLRVVCELSAVRPSRGWVFWVWGCCVISYTQEGKGVLSPLFSSLMRHYPFPPFFGLSLSLLRHPLSFSLARSFERLASRLRRVLHSSSPRTSTRASAGFSFSVPR